MCHCHPVLARPSSPMPVEEEAGRPIEMTNDPLNDVMRAWARRRESSEKQLQALTSDIMASLPRWPQIAFPDDEPTGRNLGLWPRVAYITIGAAAMLMVVLGINLTRPHAAMPISS